MNQSFAFRTHAAENLNDANPIHDDFVAKDGDAKFSIARLTRLLCREARRQNFSYHQLNYIFRNVRTKCLIEVPGRKPNKLFELPTQKELEVFFQAIHDPSHHLLFSFLLSTGVRESEACNLHWRS